MVKGKNIVVTGCLSGIGRQTMATLAKNGANVIACAFAQSDEFESECEFLSKGGVSVLPVYFDMMDNDAIKAAARTIQSKKMQVDGLVNIAGINKDALFGMITAQDLVDTFQVNCFSQILFSQYIAKLMIRQKTGGSIAFTSSVTAMDGNEGQVSYGASKAALIGAMKTMALELGKHNIRVNCVAPGVIRTPMTEKLSNELLDKKIKTMDIPRLGEAEEVANTFMYLMSDLSSHVTGQTIRVDGGIR